MLIFKRLLSQMAESKNLPPPTLANALAVTLETCREQRKLIWMLTQNTNQEKLVKLSEGCYCCKAYDRPCLQNYYGRGMPTYPQGFEENSQTSSALPPIALRKENQHLMETPAQANNVPKMDLVVGKLLARNFAHANVDTPENPKAQEPNQHLLPLRSQ